MPPPPPLRNNATTARTLLHRNTFVAFECISEVSPPVRALCRAFVFPSPLRPCGNGVAGGSVAMRYGSGMVARGKHGPRMQTV